MTDLTTRFINIDSSMNDIFAWLKFNLQVDTPRGRHRFYGSCYGLFRTFLEEDEIEVELKPACMVHEVTRVDLLKNDNCRCLLGDCECP